VTIWAKIRIAGLTPPCKYPIPPSPDQPAGLQHQQAARSDIHALSPNPEAVVEACGDVGKVERGSTGPAQPRGALDHRLHHLEIGVEVAAVAERKAVPSGSRRWARLDTRIR
jgi:hypothetical protein